MSISTIRTSLGLEELMTWHFSWNRHFLCEICGHPSSDNQLYSGSLATTVVRDPTTHTAESNESLLLYSLCSALPQWSTLASYVNITIGAHCLTILTANECQFLFLDYFDIFSCMCSINTSAYCVRMTRQVYGWHNGSIDSTVHVYYWESHVHWVV